MKKAKPPVNRLVGYIIQASVCLILLIAFFVLLTKGRSLGEWSFLIVFVFFFFIIGVWGIFLWIKEYTKPQIDENWFTKFKD